MKLEEQRELADILEKNSEEWMTIQNLSIQLGVSYKTAKKMVDQLQRDLESRGIILESKRGFGIRIAPESRSRFLVQNSSKEAGSDEIEKFLITRIILNSEEVRIDDVCEQFYCSRKKVSQIIRKIQSELSSYHLQIQSKGYHGLFLEGREENIRRFLLEQKSHLFTDQKSAFDISSVLALTGYTFSGRAVRQLQVYLQILKVRLDHGSRLDFLRAAEGKELEAANVLLEILGYTDEREAASLSALIHASRKYSEEDLERLDEYYHQNLDQLIGDICTRIKQTCHIDLSHDIDLYISLGLHILPLISRIRFSFTLSNPIGHDIKKSYPMAFDLAVCAAQVLEQKFDVRISEDEVSYLALHFNLALERRKLENVVRKNVLIICSTGAGTAKLLAYRVRSSFPDYISHVDTADLHEVMNLDCSSYDYILSCVPLPYPLEKPVLQISHMLTRKDIQSISEKLLEESGEIGLLDLIEERNFISGIDASSKEEVIRIMSAHLREIYPLQEDFEEQVMAREKLFSTELDGLVAFPHPLKQETEASFLACGILKKPMIWKNKMVQVIFMANLRKGMGPKAQRFYEEFAGLCSDSSAIVELIKKPDYASLVHLIRRKEYEY